MRVASPSGLHAACLRCRRGMERTGCDRHRLDDGHMFGCKAASVPPSAIHLVMELSAHWVIRAGCNPPTDFTSHAACARYLTPHRFAQDRLAPGYAAQCVGADQHTSDT